jgi:hypothetical protein
MRVLLGGDLSKIYEGDASEKGIFCIANAGKWVNVSAKDADLRSEYFITSRGRIVLSDCDIVDIEDDVRLGRGQCVNCGRVNRVTRPQIPCPSCDSRRNLREFVPGSSFPVMSIGDVVERAFSDVFVMDCAKEEVMF